MHSEELKNIHQRLYSEVIDQINDVSNDEGVTIAYKEDVFTQVMIDYLLDFGAIENGEVVYFERKTGYGIVKVNGYHLDQEEGRLDIFVTLVDQMEDVHTLPMGEVKKVIKQGARLHTIALKNFHKEMDPAHDDYSMLENIFMNQNGIYNKRIILLSNYIFNFDMQALSLDGFAVDLWDLKRFYKNITSIKGHESIEVDFASFDKKVKCLSIDHFNDTYETFLAVVPGQILAELYERYGSRLLELNVRSFLQAKGKINQKIRDTIKNEPEMFLAYNNGITVVSDDVKITYDGGFPIVKKISGFQIVNGGQTTASLHRASILGDDLSKISVQAKITIVEESKLEEIVPLISKYSNSQNKVSEADFSSNSVFHVEIQKLSEQVWLPGDTSRWFYERTRGQYQVQKSRYGNGKTEQRKFNTETPTSQKFTKTDLAKYVNSWDQLPHIVSLGAQKNFIRFMNRVKEEHVNDWKADKQYYKNLIAKAKLFKEVDKIAKKVGISSYKANIVTYNIAYLSYKTAKGLDLGRIWTSQQLDKPLIELVEDWLLTVSDYLINSAAGRNVTEWCKKEECWLGLKEQNLAITPDFNSLLNNSSQEVVGIFEHGNVEIINNQNEINNARLKVVNISSEVWHRIEKWGFRTQELSSFQCGIASTMASYAMQFWRKKPSAKQAIAAAKILDIALKDVLEEINEEGTNTSDSNQVIDVELEVKKWLELKTWLEEKEYLDAYHKELIMKIEFELRKYGKLPNDLKEKGEQIISDAYSEGWTFEEFYIT